MFNTQIAGDTNACDNRLPNVSISVSASSVNEGDSVTLSSVTVDANAADSHTYSWVQTAGTAATLTGADTHEATFTAPTVASSETLEFSLTVNDGTGDVVSEINVYVKDVPEVAKPASDSSSGGSMGWIALMLLPFAAFRRRK